MFLFSFPSARQYIKGKCARNCYNAEDTGNLENPFSASRRWVRITDGEEKGGEEEEEEDGKRKHWRHIRRGKREKDKEEA